MRTAVHVFLENSQEERYKRSAKGQSAKGVTWGKHGTEKLEAWAIRSDVGVVCGRRKNDTKSGCVCLLLQDIFQSCSHGEGM